MHQTLGDFLENAPGTCGELARHFFSLCRTKHPGVSLSCAIGTVSALRGERIVSSTGISPNVFCVALAPTGSGKTRTFNRIKEILIACKHESLLMGKPKSGSAIHKRLAAHPHSLLLWDELGQWLSKDNLSSHEEDIVPTLLDIYSSNGHLYVPDEFSTQNRASCYTPYLTVCGMSTHERFLSALTKEKINDGFSNRWLVFQDSKDLAFHSQDYSYEMESEAKRELARYPYTQPLVLGFDNKGTYDDICRAIELKRSVQKDSTERALWARALEQFTKLCMCFSDVNGVCSDQVLVYCWSLQTFLLDQLAVKCNLDVQDTSKEQFVYDRVARVKSLLSVGQTMTANELTRKTQYLTKSERLDIINTLLESEQWIKSATKHPTSGNNITTYTNITGLTLEAYVNASSLCSAELASNLPSDISKNSVI